MTTFAASCMSTVGQRDARLGSFADITPLAANVRLVPLADMAMAGE
jgi:hypothetical protein